MILLSISCCFFLFGQLEVSEQDVQDEMTFSPGLDTPQEVPSPPLTRPSNKLWRFVPEDEQELCMFHKFIIK